MCASEILSEVTVLLVATSAGRTTPEMWMNSSPWLSFRLLSPCTTRLPLAWTWTTVTVRLPTRLLPCELDPSPSKECAPESVVSRIGKRFVVIGPNKIEGPAYTTDELK